MMAHGVPKTHQGVWKRTLLTTRSGVHDTTSRAFWTQTQTLHVDLRIPQPPVAADKSSLEACTDDELLGLASTYAFAGITAVDGDLAIWTRLIDFEPPSKPDIGRLTWVSNDVMYEEDPDGGAPPGGAFHETWERVPGTGDCWEYALESTDGSGRKAFLLGAGDRFAFAADRPSPLPKMPGNLEALVAGSTSREEKLALLGFEVSYGSIEGFRIELSTLPGRAGASVLQEPMALAYVRRALDDPSQALMLGALPPEGGWKRAA